MKRHLIPGIVLILMVSAFVQLFSLEIGDKAPKLQISKWIQKGPVDVTDGKKIYLMEFWATWCQPCQKSIPHLIELQKQYESKGVCILGISTEGPETVKNFLANLKKNGVNVEYPIGLDDNQKSFKEYMGAQSGIPHIFIIDKNGVIVWSGSPYDADKILPKIVSGNYDIKSLKLEKSNIGQVQMILQGISPNNNAEKIMSDIIKILKITPDDRRVLEMFAYLLNNKNLEVLPYFKTLCEKTPDNSMVQLYFLRLSIINDMDYKKQAENILNRFKNNKKVLTTMADDIMNNVSFGKLDAKLLMKIINNIEKEPMPENNKEKAQLHILKVQALYLSGKISQAIKEQKIVLSLNPTEKNKKILEFLNSLTDETK